MLQLAARRADGIQSGGTERWITRRSFQMVADCQVDLECAVGWLIVDQTMGSQRPPQGQLVAHLMLGDPHHRAK